MAQNYASSPHFWDQFCQQSTNDIMTMIRTGVPVNQVRERILAMEDDVINHMDSITAAQRMRQCLQTCLQLQRIVNRYAQGTYQDSPGQVRSRSRSPLRSIHSLPTTPVRSPRRTGFRSVPSTPIKARPRNTLGSPQRSPLRFSSNASSTTSSSLSERAKQFSGRSRHFWKNVRGHGPFSHTPSSASSQHSQEDYDEDVEAEELNIDPDDFWREDEEEDEEGEDEEGEEYDENEEYDEDEEFDVDDEDEEDEEDEEGGEEGEDEEGEEFAEDEMDEEDLLNFAIANPYEGQMGLAVTPPLPLVDQTVDLYFLVPINEQDFQQQQTEHIEEVIHEEEENLRELVGEGDDGWLNNLFEQWD